MPRDKNAVASGSASCPVEACASESVDACASDEHPGGDVVVVGGYHGHAQLSAGASPAEVMDEALAEFDAQRQALAAPRLPALRRMVAEVLDALDRDDACLPMSSPPTPATVAAADWRTYVAARRRHFCSDDTLLRYLRARDGDADAALVMLRATLKWRERLVDPAARKAEDEASLATGNGAGARVNLSAAFNLAEEWPLLPGGGYHGWPVEAAAAAAAVAAESGVGPPRAPLLLQSRGLTPARLAGPTPRATAPMGGMAEDPSAAPRTILRSVAPWQPRPAGGSLHSSSAPLAAAAGGGIATNAAGAAPGALTGAAVGASAGAPEGWAWAPPPQCKACATVDPCSHCFYRLGLDRAGRHVIYSCAGRCTNLVVQDNMLHMAFELERIFNHESGPGKVTWVIDFKGFALRHTDPRLGATALPMFASHYPERMGQIVLLDPPALFNLVWTAIQPVLDPVTKSKIVMLRGREAFRAYADVEWRDPALHAWIRAVQALPGRPGSFPEEEDEDGGSEYSGECGADGGAGGSYSNDHIRSSSSGGSVLVWELRDPVSAANLKRARDSRR